MWSCKWNKFLKYQEAENISKALPSALLAAKWISEAKTHWLYFFKGCLICQNTSEYSRTVMGFQLSRNLSFLPSPPWQKLNIWPKMKSNTFPFINLLNSPRCHMNPLLHYPDLSLALETFKTTHLQHRDICGIKVKHKNGDKWTMIDSQCQSKQIHGPISQHSFVFSEYIYWDGLDIITYSKDMNLSKLQEDSKGQGSLVCCSPWGLKRVRHYLAAEQQQFIL